MANLDSLLPELQFLSELLCNRDTQYRDAKWRTSSFNAEFWETDFGLRIDFRVHLDDGARLTDLCHHSLLEVFKTWLCVQGHLDATGGQLVGDTYVQSRVRMTLHLIDYFLLNANRFQLAKHGLQNISENDLSALLMQIAESSSVVTSIYRWPRFLEIFLRSQLQTIDQAELFHLTNCQPLLLSSIPEPSSRMLGLSDDEIVRARAWLWKSGLYIPAKGEWSRNPNTKRLANEIYANTLAGRCKKPVPDELRLASTPSYIREYPAAPVTHDSEDRASDVVLSCYLATLRRLALLEQVMLPVPTAALGAIDQVSLTPFLEPKKPGRYRNLPQAVAFASLRNSIEFSLEYGEDLVASYLNIARHAKLAGLPCRSYCTQTDIRSLLTAKLVALGVRVWTIDRLPRVHGLDRKAKSRHKCFQLLRENLGLWELLRVLYGSVEVCIGTLMARRQGELSDLIAGRCLDISMTRLIFFNRKSGITGMREKEARPAPTIAVKQIRLLERLQNGLTDIGELTKCTNLFAHPSHSGTGLIKTNASQHNESLDFFCDYFEMPLNSEGERYYIRQHQLRRFFAMLFFWGRAFGGMDTLRWFLGHTDLKHLYHYITESIPGAMLRSIKATYATEQIVAHTAEAEKLADILERHFSTRDFSVLDSDEMNEYIDDLIAEGKVQVEPEFFDTPQGISYRILILVTAKDRVH